MYESGKMRPAETIPGMGRWGVKENGGEMNSTMMYCKSFCTCLNVFPLQQLYNN
jgi:hypothetical protein